MSAIITLAVACTVLMLFSCLKAASDADDEAERIQAEKDKLA